MITPAELTDWYASAEHGDSFVYGHAGEREYPHANTMRTARQLYEAGSVALTGRREPGKRWAYIAQRVKP